MFLKTYFKQLLIASLLLSFAPFYAHAMYQSTDGRWHWDGTDGIHRRGALASKADREAARTVQQEITQPPALTKQCSTSKVSECKLNVLISQHLNKVFGTTLTQRLVRVAFYSGGILLVLKGGQLLWNPTNSHSWLWIHTCKATDACCNGLSTIGCQLLKSFRWTFRKIFSSRTPKITAPSAHIFPTPEELLFHEQCVSSVAERGLITAIEKSQTGWLKSKLDPVKILQELKAAAQRGCYLAWKRIHTCVHECYTQRATAIGNKFLASHTGVAAALQTACEDECLQKI